MLDLRFIVGSLIIIVALAAFAASLFVPVGRDRATATLKPRIEPSRIAEPAPAPRTEPVKQTAAPLPAPAVAPAANAAAAPMETTAVQLYAPPAPKQAAAPVAGIAPKQAATPARTAIPAPEITGSIAEPKPAPKRIVRKKEEPEYGFQWPWMKGWNRGWQQN